MEDDILDLMRAALSTEQNRVSVTDIGVNYTNSQYLKHRLLPSCITIRSYWTDESWPLLLYPDGGSTWVNGKFQGQ
jgi:hypothetical protein